jgi:hypothetical protein
MDSFFTWHIFLEVGKTQDLPSKIWQILGDALRLTMKGNEILRIDTLLPDHALLHAITMTSLISLNTSWFLPLAIIFGVKAGLD